MEIILYTNLNSLNTCYTKYNEFCYPKKKNFLERIKLYLRIDC